MRVFAQLAIQAPWAVVVIYLIHEVAQLLKIQMVRNSNSDMFIRKRWNSFEVRRGKADSEPATVTKPKARRTLRSVATPDPDSEEQPPSSGQATG
jgi:hypothetical protein